ncbi:MAG: hypothetical protein ACE5QV_04760 [Fidelibacterota bacterium]
MTKFYFDFRDVFRAPRLAFSGKKIWVQFVGFLAGFVVYLILAYLAFLADGWKFSYIWQEYHLFPTPFQETLSWYSWAIFIIGMIGWLVTLILSSTCVSKITYQQLKGDEFYSMGDSLKFLKKNWKAPLLAPLTLIIIILFFLILGEVFGFIGRIPYLGEIVFGFPVMTVLYFFTAVFVVFTAVVTVISIILSPAIVGTAEEDTMETIVQNFSSLWSQFWRLVTYEGILTGLIAAGLYILTLATYYGSLLIYQVFKLGFIIVKIPGIDRAMGDKMTHMIGTSLTLFPSRLVNFTATKIAFLINLLPKIELQVRNLGDLIYIPKFAAPDFTASTPASLYTVAWGYVVGVLLFLLVFAVISYGATICTSGQTIIYLILRKKKDDENLLEREEEKDEEEEFKVEEPEKPREEEKAEAEEGKAEEEKGEEEKKEGSSEEEKKGE